jgi:hypothetical protein
LIDIDAKEQKALLTQYKWPFYALMVYISYKSFKKKRKGEILIFKFLDFNVYCVFNGEEDEVGYRCKMRWVTDANGVNLR